MGTEKKREAVVTVDGDDENVISVGVGVWEGSQYVMSNGVDVAKDALSDALDQVIGFVRQENDVGAVNWTVRAMTVEAMGVAQHVTLALASKMPGILVAQPTKLALAEDDEQIQPVQLLRDEVLELASFGNLDDELLAALVADNGMEIAAKIVAVNCIKGEVIGVQLALAVQNRLHLAISDLEEGPLEALTSTRGFAEWLVAATEILPQKAEVGEEPSMAVEPVGEKSIAQELIELLGRGKLDDDGVHALGPVVAAKYLLVEGARARALVVVDRDENVLDYLPEIFAVSGFSTRLRGELHRIFPALSGLQVEDAMPVEIGAWYGKVIVSLRKLGLTLLFSDPMYGQEAQ